MAKEKYLLKILSGPHQGAEVALDEGQLIIGSAQDCDLILSDTLVSPHHLKIEVTESGVSIVPLESPVYFDGQEIAKDAHFTVEPFKFISIGTTHFVIGPTEGEWPPLSAVDIPNLTKMEKETSNQEPAEGEVLDAEALAASKMQVPENQNINNFEKNKRWIIMGVVSLILIIVIVVVSIAFNLTEHKEETPVDLKQAIAKVIADKGLERYLTVEENDGIYEVKGWVNNGGQRDKIDEELRKLSPDIDTEIRVGSDAVANIKDLLNGLGANYASAEGIEPGKVRTVGYYGDDQDWESIKSDIARDVPGLKLLKDDVMTPKKLYNLIANVLKEDKVEGLVQYVPQREGIILKGMISQTDVPKVKKSILHLQSEVGSRVPIRNQIVVAKPEDLYLDLDMDSVIIGKQGFIVTKSGQRLFEGGILKDGYVIKKISREGIVLEKDDQIITLNLGENI